MCFIISLGSKLSLLEIEPHQSSVYYVLDIIMYCMYTVYIQSISARL